MSHAKDLDFPTAGASDCRELLEIVKKIGFLTILLYFQRIVLPIFGNPVTIKIEKGRRPWKRSGILMKDRKIVLVGTGFVGMSMAYSFLTTGGIDEKSK